MYDYLEGRVAGRSAARLVLDVGGVGFDLAVPLSASFPSPPPDEILGGRAGEGGRVRVWTHLVVREDAHLLFGFPDPPTRDLFRSLLTVRGVGPAVAMGILSGLSRSELLAALLAGDVRKLTTVRGVGKRIAEQILLDLRDKAPMLAAAALAGGAVPPASPDAQRTRRLEDAVGALISIGYPEKEARRQIERASREVDPEDLELLVRTALQG